MSTLSMRDSGEAPPAPYRIDGDDSTKLFVARWQRTESKAHVHRGYLVLLCSAGMLSLDREIPHLASARKYTDLLAIAFPHHAKQRAQTPALTDIDPEADLQRLLALLDDDGHEEIAGEEPAPGATAQQPLALVDADCNGDMEGPQHLTQEMRDEMQAWGVFCDE